MTQQLRAAAAVGAAAALLVIGLPLMILLALDPASASSCGGTPTGPGPSSVPGIPQNLLPIFEGASQQVRPRLRRLGLPRRAQLRRVDVRHQRRARHRRALRIQLGRRGRPDADRDRRPRHRQLGHDRLRDPRRACPAGRSHRASTTRPTPSTAPPRCSRSGGRPATGRRRSWRGTTTRPRSPRSPSSSRNTRKPPRAKRAGTPVTSTPAAPVPAGGQGCVPVIGPATPGAVARVLPNGLAEIPQGAPAAVQEMIAAGNQIIGYPYSYAGGHSPASMRVPPGPSADPGQQENGGPGYDCSSAVSFVLWGGGLGQSLLGGQVPDSWTLMGAGAPGARPVGDDLRRHLRRAGPHVHRGRRDRARHRARLTHQPAGHRAPLAARLRDRLRALQRLLRHPPPPRPMTRPRALLIVLACLLALAGCGGSHTTTPTAAPRAPATPSDTTPRGENAAALFAAAYVRFLDGRRSKQRCLTRRSGVRALAGQAGPIPAARRQGTLVISELRPATGAKGSYLLAARDDAHTFYAQITVAERRRPMAGRGSSRRPTSCRYSRPRARPPPAPPPGSAARRGRRPAVPARLPAVAVRARAAPRDHMTPPAGCSRISRRIRRESRRPCSRCAPKVAAIAMQRHGRGWQALPNINDGNETYELVLTLTQTRGRWLVSTVGSTR